MQDNKTVPSLYVGTYGKYNDGSIAGAWLNLDDYEDADGFMKACKKLHKDELDPEYMFQDFEGFPKEFYSESMSFSELEKLYDYVKLDDDDKEIVDEYIDATGYSFNDFDVDDVKEKLYCILDGWGSNEKNIGEYVVDNGLVEVPYHLESHIDYESLGSEWLSDMSVSDNGYVFIN